MRLSGMKRYIGIDIGGMSIKAGIVDGDGNIEKKLTRPTDPTKHYSLIVDDIFRLCASLLDSAGLAKADIEAVGMGSPGTVNSKLGIITFSGNLNFKNVNIVKEFAKHWDIRAAVNNDANCAALGEMRFGNAKGVKNLIFVTLGTGIGTGFIIDGKIFEGMRGEGAEGGHVRIRMNGEKCTCGERGCWEAYASASALLRMAGKEMLRHPESVMNEMARERGGLDGKVPFDAFRAGDATATRLIRRYIRYVAEGLVGLINIFRPEVVAIGGGVSNAGEEFVRMIEKVTAKHAFGSEFNKLPRIVRAGLGNDAGIVGAAAPVMDEYA